MVCVADVGPLRLSVSACTGAPEGAGAPEPSEGGVANGVGVTPGMANGGVVAGATAVGGAPLPTVQGTCTRTSVAPEGTPPMSVLPGARPEAPGRPSEFWAPPPAHPAKSTAATHKALNRISDRITRVAWFSTAATSALLEAVLAGRPPPFSA